MTTEEALLALSGAIAEAAVGALSSIYDEEIVPSTAAVVGAGEPLQSITYPAVAAAASFTDGVVGGSLFTTTRLGALQIAAMTAGRQAPSEDNDTELGEAEMSAVAKAMAQMMAAGTGALAGLLGDAVGMSAPTTTVLDSAAAAEGLCPQTPQVTEVLFTARGQSCRLIQFIPSAFVARLAGEPESVLPGAGGVAFSDDLTSGQLSNMLRDVAVHVSAELGRATVTVDQLYSPSPGAVIELDALADDPVDLCVNGRRFATGRLFLIDQTEWALQIERVLAVSAAEIGLVPADN